MGHVTPDIRLTSQALAAIKLTTLEQNLNPRLMNIMFV